MDLRVCVLVLTNDCEVTPVSAGTPRRSIAVRRGRRRLAALLYYTQFDGRTEWRLARTASCVQVGPRATRSTGSNASATGPHPSYRRRHGAPRHRPDIGNPLHYRSQGDPATYRWYSIRPASLTVRPGFATSRRGTRQPPVRAGYTADARSWRWRPDVGLAPGRGAGLCPWRLTLVGRSLCPLEGGRSRRSNFLAALNVLRVACCGRHGRQRMDARGAFCARNQIKFSRKHYRTN